MTRTGSLPEAVAVAGRAIGYRRGPEGLQSNADTLPPRGSSAGGGYSTVRDLLRFATALEAGRLLPATRVAQLTTGAVEMPLAPAELRYGRGFFESRRGSRRWFGHGGGAPGMNGDLRIYPESGYVVVALSNLDPPAASAMTRFAAARLPE
jgi:CubicO group peptidase (beta-lactamase class C family)